MLRVASHWGMPGTLLALLIFAGPGCSHADRVPSLLFEQPPASTADGVGAAKALTVKFSDKPLPVPAFSLASLDGKPISSADWQGKVVLINFWATWCGPCREEIPVLVALQERYRDSLVVVGLSIDERPASEVKAFVDSHRINYQVAIADAKVQHDFGGISAVPSTYVVNPASRIVQRHVGLISPFLSEQEVRALSGQSLLVKVETVQDTGQVLLANAAYATDIPGLTLSALTPAQREQVLRRLNTESCTCGCGLTMAQCRINDPGCVVSLPAAQQVVAGIVGGK
jgi:thiol-disulfide isomerase/thioredoxin